MADTRFNNDDVRVRKQNEILTYNGRYQLETPGPGSDLPYQEDPHIRLTKWGANACNNSTNIESDLRGLSTSKREMNGAVYGAKSLSHQTPDYRSIAAPQERASFGTAAAWVEDTRSTQPAWMYRELEFSQWNAPLCYAVPPANVDFNGSGEYSRNARFNPY